MKIIDTFEVRHVREMIEALQAIIKTTGYTQDEVAAIYLYGGNDDPFVLKLIENTLTDGSKTYDVRIS
jgi:hypothetical protein